MKIQPPADVRKSNPFVGFLLFLLIGAAALAAAAYFLAPKFYYKNLSSVTPLEVVTFAGKGVEVSPTGHKWEKPRVGAAVSAVQHIRTGADGEIDLQYGKTGFIRLKENSEVVYMAPAYNSSAQARLQIVKGNALVANTGGENFEIAFTEKSGPVPPPFYADSSTMRVRSEGTSYYMVSMNSAPSIHNLRGKVFLNSLGKETEVKERESLLNATSAGVKPSQISQDDWRLTREAYEVPPKSAASEAAQLDMAKKSGNFFRFVIDHGTFYQQKFGWCEREFVTPGDGSPVYLETTYDVFPVSSWVGVYLKTRNFDISKFKTFKMEARRIEGRPHPDNIRIEFKAKYQVIQAFAIKMVQKDWEKIEFPLRISKETPINEMTIIFSNDKVGSEKSGGVQFRNFELVDADKKPEKPAEPAKAPESLKVATRVAQNASAITKEAPAAVKAPVKPVAQKAAEPAEDDSLKGLEEL